MGSPADIGPVASMYEGATSNCIFSCTSCEVSWPHGMQIYTPNSIADEFRIAWGEYGSQSEGWRPWFSGLVFFR